MQCKSIIEKLLWFAIICFSFGYSVHIIQTFFVDNDIDISILPETWLLPADDTPSDSESFEPVKTCRYNHILKSLLPNGFDIFHGAAIHVQCSFIVHKK